MKTLKTICTTAVLALVVSVPTYAGDVATPGCASSTDTNSENAVSTAWGEIGSPSIADFLWAVAFMS